LEQKKELSILIRNLFSVIEAGIENEKPDKINIETYRTLLAFGPS
jgi:hypothetical protein